MKPAQYVTIMLVPDGTEARHGLRLRTWVLRLILAALAAILVGIVLFFAFYGSVLSRAAVTDRVKEENERLRRYQYKVQMLEENLKHAREVVTRITKLAGIEYQFPELPEDSVVFAAAARPQAAVIARSSEPDLHWPAGLPIAGFITQEFEVHDSVRFHPGVDIACAEGTPVLATAAGEIVFADFDSTYGYMVVIKHSDSVATVYGHNNELLVDVGQVVLAGSRIALSGNTGISTAPHLHYEMRLKDEPINPLKDAHDEEE